MSDIRYHVIQLASDLTWLDPEEARAYVGRTLRQARVRAGLTAQQLADSFEPPVSVSTVTSWERGRTTPGREARAQIDRILRPSAESLRDGGGEGGYVFSLDPSPSRRAVEELLWSRASGLSEEGLRRLADFAELLGYKYPAGGGGEGGAGA